MQTDDSTLTALSKNSSICHENDSPERTIENGRQLPTTAKRKKDEEIVDQNVQDKRINKWHNKIW